MNADPNPAKAIFLEAVERHAPDQWPAFLDRACAGQPDLRGRVEALLAAHREVGTARHRELAEGADPSPVATVDEPPVREQPGAVIGPYKLLEPIGEGGFGVVFLAEQTEPVRRKVALKVLKPGMDTRQVVVRFEAERQALAIMDHPNIAKVFDGGATPSGRPYFVMELVKGVPITEFCDQNHLTPRQRLELFVPVCQAVQHAHQKGIIHRDLKPSNVLVSRHDTTPVVKVIDFGVAKALGQDLTDKTLFTGVAQMVGTPLYMSPEQAGMSDLDVDTRSDIYSLGVLLYELLTGTTPFTKQRFKQAAYDEIRRIIREEEPSRPSTRLSELKDSLPSISAQRHTEPAKLTRLVRGELDWIVMKALEKDRSRRYETANGFAMDVQRYLADEPVLACPPSAGYRLRKLARRNKTALATVALLGVMLLAVAGILGWAVRDRAARQARLEVEAAGALDQTEKLYQLDKLPEARAALQRAEGLLGDAGGSEEVRHRLRQWRVDLEMVARLEGIRLERAASRVGVKGRETFDWAGADAAYADTFRGYGLDVEALGPDEAARCVRASAIREAIVAALDDWVWSKREAGRSGANELLDVARRADPDPWRDRVRGALQREDQAALLDLVRTREFLGQPPATLLLVSSLLTRKEGPLAAEVLRQAQERHPADFWINFRLAEHLARRDRAGVDAALGFYRAALALRPESPGVYMSLGNAYLARGEPAEAEAAYRKAIEVRPDEASARNNLGVILKNQGKLDAAEALYREAIRVQPDYVLVHGNLGLLYAEQKRWSEALAAYERATQGGGSAIACVGFAKLLTTCPETPLRDPQRAVVMAQRAVDLAPKEAWNWQILGWSRYRAGQWQAAIDALEQSIALQDDPKGGDPWQWYFLAMAHWKLGHPDEAVGWYTKSVDWTEGKAPGNEEVRAFRAEAEQLIPADAIVRRYEKGLADEPDSPQRLTQRAVTLARLGRIDAAVENFLQAIERGKPSTEEIAESSEVYHAVFRWEPVFERIAERRPGDAQLWRERARFLARRRRWKEAAEAYARVVESERPWFEYAHTLVLAGDRDEYRGLCGRLQERHGRSPLNGNVDVPLACALSPESGIEPARVVSWADEVVKQKRNKFTLHALAAEYRADRFDDAVRHLHEALDHQAPRSSIAFPLALAYHRLGRQAESRAWYAIGRQELDRVTPRDTNDPAPWAITHWLNVNVSSREAEAVLGDAKPEPKSGSK